jgi:hypothetical protein
MDLPNPLSIDRARGYMDFQFDRQLAGFLGVSMRVLTYHRKNHDGILPAPYRAMIEAHLLKSERAQQVTQ